MSVLQNLTSCGIERRTQTGYESYACRIYTIMRFKCDYSDSIDETFKMIMPIANKKDELIHHVYIGLNKAKISQKTLFLNLKKWDG